MSLIAAARLLCLPKAYGASRSLRNLFLAATLAAATPALAEPLTLVALGDSLTQGYGLQDGQGFVPQLQAWLNGRGAEVTVVNAGVSGDTTAGGLARTDWALTPDTDAVIVTLGGNDFLRGLSPDQARVNLDAILEKIDGRGLPVLLVAMSAPGNYGPDYKTAFDAIYPDLAARHGAILAEDFFGPIRSAARNGTPAADLMQPDGLHPSADGVALVVDALGPSVLDLLARAGS